MDIRTRPQALAVAAAAFAALLLLGHGPASGESFWGAGPERPAPSELARMSAMLHEAAERVRPSVVEIRVTKAAAARVSPADARGNAASGLIVRPDGWILTNAHVVAGAARIQVALADGRRLDGRLVGKDERSDLALVRVEASGLPAARPGDSSALRLGELVLAMGHPFGRELTVSLGIVSRASTRPDGTPALDFIQTDAAVNPGNSGGPIVNMAGEVVGITTLATRNGSIGFAIPVNTVRALLPELVERGRVAWGWLGIAVAEPEATPAGDVPAGAVVTTVVPGGPAERAGLRPRDRLLAVDGRPLDRLAALEPALGPVREGSKVTLVVARGSERLSLRLEAAAYPEGLSVRPAGASPAAASY